MKKFMLFIMLCIMSIVSISAPRGPAPTRGQIVNAARSEAAKGYGYGYGKKGENGLIDCSGFITNVFKRVGLSSGVDSKGFANSGKQIDISSVKAGDLIYMPPKNGASHIMMVVSTSPLQVADSASGIGSSVRTVSLETLRARGAIGVDFDTIINEVEGRELKYKNNNVEWKSGIVKNGEQPVEEKATAINYGADNSINFDDIAQKYTDSIKQVTPKIYGTAVVFMSILLIIQLTMDTMNTIPRNDIGALISNIYRRSIGFTMYMYIATEIYTGGLINLVKDMVYGIVSKFTNTEGFDKLMNIWDTKNSITGDLWKLFAKLWNFTLSPTQLADDLIASIIILFVIILVNVLFFMIMFDLFKIFIGFILTMNLGMLLLPFGMLDVTRQYYNIGKIISMILNFIIKMVFLNIIVILSMKSLAQTTVFMNLQNFTVSSLADGTIVAFIFILYMTYQLCVNLNVEF